MSRDRGADGVSRRALLAGAASAGAVALAGCSASDTQPEPTEVEGVPADVERFVDRDAGVVCWTFNDHDAYAGAGGLSCLPLEETDLAGGGESDGE